MSNPTTPFSWQMPTATDLVTDLPADFEVFGQAVATSMADLLGGTSGQILAKNSNTDMDFVWVTNDVGDITAVTAGTGITGGGTSGAVTITNDMATTITAAGDIVVGTGSGTYDNLPIGTTNQVLTADTTVSPYKVKWATVSSSPTFVGCQVYRTTNLSTSNGTTTSITYDSEVLDTDGFHSTVTNTDRLTVPTGKGGKYLINAQISWAGNTTGARELRLHKFTPSETTACIVGNYPSNASAFLQQLTWIQDLTAGDYLVVKVEQASGGSLNVTGSAAAYTCWASMIYLGA
jgi:hypothetical protein